jgi:succinoglycan biosynthesis transport protein ExoP
VNEERDFIRNLPKLRRNAVLMLLSLLAGVGGAQAVTAFISPTYQASASVLITSSITDKEQLFLPRNAQTLMPTIARLAESRTVAAATAKAVGLPTAIVANQISANFAEGVQILTLTARAGTATRAAAIANAAVGVLESEVGRMNHGTMDSVWARPLDTATAPAVPVSPKPFLDAVLGALLGLLAGAGLARLRNLTDDKIVAVEDLSEATSAPVLGSVPLDRRVPREPLIVHRPHSDWAEAFRHLRTNLEFVDVDSPPRLVAVTSAVPHEGKSIMACNLAMAMAGAGRSVLLIEADLRQPRAGEYLGAVGGAGLTTVLAGQAELRDVTQQCGEDGLSFLAAGPLPPNPGELLASQRCRALLRQLREHYDAVLLDLPPMTVADAAVLAGLADGTIVVTRYRGTRIRQLRRSIGALSTVNARLLGCVLNMTPSSSNGYRYGYGYGAGAQLPTPSTPPEQDTPQQVGSNT